LINLAISPALKGDPYNPSEVDRRISEERQARGVEPLDPDKPHTPEELVREDPKKDKMREERGSRHRTGERNVSSSEEHSRVPKGSNGMPRRR
jgi:hypothetical protein